MILKTFCEMTPIKLAIYSTHFGCFFYFIAANAACLQQRGREKMFCLQSEWDFLVFMAEDLGEHPANEL